MNYYCSVCDKTFEVKSENKHVKTLSHKEFVQCKHFRLTTKDSDVNKIDNGYCFYIVEHIKKVDYYLVYCVFQLVYNDGKFSPYIPSKVLDNKALYSWKIF